jgi:hypothetical protein
VGGKTCVMVGMLKSEAHFFFLKKDLECAKEGVKEQN